LTTEMERKNIIDDRNGEKQHYWRQKWNTTEGAKQHNVILLSFCYVLFLFICSSPIALVFMYRLLLHRLLSEHDRRSKTTLLTTEMERNNIIDDRNGEKQHYWRQKWNTTEGAKQHYWQQKWRETTLLTTEMERNNVVLLLLSCSISVVNNVVSLHFCRQ
jgi:Na+-translocating ferredoxin:NAD+ oxidoreductase RnfC subunit